MDILQMNKVFDKMNFIDPVESAVAMTETKLHFGLMVEESRCPLYTLLFACLILCALYLLWK